MDRAGYLTPLFKPRSKSTPAIDDPEVQPLHDDFAVSDARDNRHPRLTRYGSIIGSPPRESNNSLRGRGPPSLDLPAPALRSNDQPLTSTTNDPQLLYGVQEAAKGLEQATADEVGKTKQPPHPFFLSLRHRALFRPQRVNSLPLGSEELTRPATKRHASLGARGSRSPGDFPLHAYRVVDVKQAEFFNFLDGELEKVESFYKEKEDDATARLEVLRQQLHIMRDRRIEELAKARRESNHAKRMSKAGVSNGYNGHVLMKTDSLLNKLDRALETAKHGKFGKQSKAFETLGTPHVLEGEDQSNRDYIRKKQHSSMPYRAAKKKLKLAIQEYYRSLELLKSYALLNRKAFRKINKKYDKATNARPALRYVSEKVNDAYFVKSDVVDGHIRIIEDLYARYFEGGNHKVAAGKLRAKSQTHFEHTAVVFRNGLYVAGGLVFAIEGLVYAAQLLRSPDAFLAANTAFLLQVSSLESRNESVDLTTLLQPPYQSLVGGGSNA